MYIAAVLTPESIIALKETVLATPICLDSYFFVTPVGGILPHHMTINLGSFDSQLNSPEILGQAASIQVSEVHIDESLGVCAVAVDSCTVGTEVVHSVNSHSHITLALKNGVKPKVSNELFKSKSSFKFPLENLRLDAFIKLCD